MELKEFNDKRVMHIDTSCKLYERKDTGIAYKIINSNAHKGVALSIKLKKELERDFKINEDYAKLYAICIYCLIKDDLNLFDVLVICGDEDFTATKLYLDLLLTHNLEYKHKRIISVYELRKITGKNKLKSYADNLSRSYRKRALKSRKRQQIGTLLNPIRINYRIIKEKIEEINNL